ncbi:MAG: hypothetical protein IK121_09790 [Lachnospiraceae bacterium]|nr:hypothetical protein [Lachnospiraceae bacterium]
MRVTRESLEKRIKEKEEDIRRREAEKDNLQRRLDQMDKEAAGEILKRHNMTPKELAALLEKEKSEGEKLIAEERRLRNEEVK